MGEEKIKEAPAAASCTFDELEILSAKGDGAEGAEVIGELADGLFVEGEATLVFAPVKFDGVRGSGDDAAAHEPAGLAVADHRRAAHAAEAPQGGEQMNGFEQVGFALRIAAEQHVKARPEVGIEPPVVSKIAQSQMPQVHGRLWAEGGAGGNHCGFKLARGWASS